MDIGIIFVHEDDKEHISHLTHPHSIFPTHKDVQQLQAQGVRLWEMELEAPAIIYLPCWIFHGFQSCSGNDEV